RDEIGKMQHVITFTMNLTNQLVIQIINFAIIAGDRHRAVLAIKLDTKLRAFKTARIATLALPDNSFGPEIKGRKASIGRFPVVLKVIAIAAASHSSGRSYLKTPAREVKRMHAVIAQFTRAPIPKPMP